MAVQAQCSSNVFLLNRTQIGNKYSLPPQPGGDGGGDGSGGGGGIATTFLDHQSINHNLFNNFQGGNQLMYNHYQQQQQSNCNQMMNVSTGLKLAFNDHQSSGFISQDLSSLINQQGDEIEHYIQSQGDEFRRKLAEKRQRHYQALIGTAKESATRMIKEKEVEAERAVRRHAELEARASQLTAEAQVWQARARAQEAVAAALQAQLQQAIVTGVGGCVSKGEEVAARDAEDAESSYIDPERVVVVSGPGCKACGKRVASVVLLPCRHLCVCSECDDVVQSCPLCLSFRSSSIEVYM